jgi:hypothetical protein
VDFFRVMIGNNLAEIGEFSAWTGGSIMAFVVLFGTVELAITYQQEFWSILMEVFNIPAYAWNWITDTNAAVNSAIWKGLADFNCELSSSFRDLAASTKAISKEPFLGLLDIKEVNTLEIKTDTPKVVRRKKADVQK